MKNTFFDKFFFVLEDIHTTFCYKEPSKLCLMACFEMEDGFLIN